ncbi:MAG: PAS domain S-box protein [Candidatus Sericytochromatia bacterium]|nr:PAS domain S-box protein [Candidatus Sericytochromatia bacterium]
MLKIVVWIALIIPICANLYSYRSMYEMNISSNLVDKIQRIIDSIDHINLNLIELESEEKSYLFSFDKYRDLHSYKIYQKKINQELKNFYNLIRDNKSQNEKVNHLNLLIHNKIGTFNKLVNNKIDKNNSIEYQNYLQKNKEVITTITNLIHLIKIEQENLLHDNIKNEHKSRSATFIQTSLGDILGLLLLLSAFYFLYRENRVRRFTEEELKESEEKFRGSFNYAAIGMAILSIDGKFLKVNLALCKMTGYSEEDLLIKKLDDLTHYGDINIDQDKINKLLNNKISSYQIEKRLFDINDNIITSLLSFSVVHDINSQSLYFVVQIQDITQRKQIEEELEYKNVELERSNTSLIEFSYVVSHDLKEPLRLILDNLNTLSDKNYLDNKVTNLIKNTFDTANRMKQFISDLLTYSMADIHGELDFNDCNQIVDQVIKNLKLSIDESHVNITYKSLPNIEADAVRLEQLFQNLISNAIKYNKNPSPEIHIGVEFKNGQFVFSVSDNGIGILLENKDLIFNLFSRLHSPKEYSGTGIGLAVCKKIVEYYNGKIWVDSVPQKGSVFYFTLPGRNN